MPIFEYECKSCGLKFEELVSQANPEVECPKCRSLDTGKLISSFAASIGGGSSATPSCARPGCGGPGFT